MHYRGFSKWNHRDVKGKTQMINNQFAARKNRNEREWWRLKKHALLCQPGSAQLCECRGSNTAIIQCDTRTRCVCITRKAKRHLSGSVQEHAQTSTSPSQALHAQHTSAPFIPTSIHLFPACFAVNGYTQWGLCLIWLLGWGRGSALCERTATQACWNLMDEALSTDALCVKFRPVNAHKGND